MITSESTDKIAPAWVQSLHAVNAVVEDGSGHHGTYATLGACLAAVKPVLAANRLALQQYATESDRGVCIRTRIWHEEGQWIEDEGLTMPAPSDPQKVGGAVTYARRYALVTFFAISTADDDGHEATQAIRQPARQTAPQGSESDSEAGSSPSAGRQVFEALKRQKGTPAAEKLKAWAKPKTITLDSLENDDEWCEQVANKLADILEA